MSSEREIPAGPVASPGVEGPPELVERVSRLLGQTKDRAPNLELAISLANGFEGLSRHPSREGADLLISAMTRPELGRWRAGAAGTLRTAAVEALVRMGHPYALEVVPEALVEALADRRGQAPSDGRRQLAWALVFGHAVTLVPALGLLVDRGAAMLALAPLLAAVLGLLAHKPTPRWQRLLGRLLLGLTGLAELFALWNPWLAAPERSPALVWGSVSGALLLLAALLFGGSPPPSGPLLGKGR